MGAKLDWSKPIQLSNGDAARLIATINNPERPRVVAVMRNSGTLSGTEYSCEYAEDGVYISSGCPSTCDVINVPPKMMRINLANPNHSVQLYDRSNGEHVLVVMPTGRPHGITSESMHHVKLPDFIDVEVIE